MPAPDDAAALAADTPQARLLRALAEHPAATYVRVEVIDLRAALQPAPDDAAALAAARLTAMADTLHAMGLCRTKTAHTRRAHEPDAERLLAALPVHPPAPDDAAARLRDAINFTAIPTLTVFADKNAGVREALRILRAAVDDGKETRDQRWERHVRSEIERIKKAAVG